MELLSVPRMMISGVSAGVGKSLVTLGLAMELRKRGMSVSCAVLGLNMVDAMLLKRICGRNVVTLDDGLLNSSQLLLSTYVASVGADVLLILGRNGLFDGTPQGGYFLGSDSEMAALIKSPVCLTIDARGMGTSVSAIAKGFSDLAKGFKITGLIANRLPNDEGNFELQKGMLIEAEGGFPELPPILGCIPNVENSTPLPRRAAVTQRRNQTSLDRKLLVDLGNLIGSYVDVDQLLKAARDADYIRLEDFEYRPESRRCRIAVSDDSAFNLCFQDNLEYLRYFGAELIPFSPLADRSLPSRIGGIYLTGAYLEEYGSDIANNTYMYKALQEFYQSGGVIYAEGGGAAYLSESFSLKEAGRAIPGIGIIPGHAITGSEGFRFQEMQLIEESILGRPGLRVQAINYGEWVFHGVERTVKAIRVANGSGDPYLDGISPGAQVLATLSFQHWGSNPEIPKALVDSVSVVNRSS